MRGWLLNNPCNVDRTGIPWLGKSVIQQDPRFVSFVSRPWGYRCAARIIHVHWSKYRTVRNIINRWAPPIENNTSAYVTDVAKRMGVDPDIELDWETHAVPLLRAITYHEQGDDCPVDDAEIVQGIELEAA